MADTNESVERSGQREVATSETSNVKRPNGWHTETYDLNDDSGRKQFIDRLSRHAIQDDKFGAAFVPACMPGNERSGDKVEWLECFVADVDNDMSADEVFDACKATGKWFVGTTSHSHGKDVSEIPLDKLSVYNKKEGVKLEDRKTKANIADFIKDNDRYAGIDSFELVSNQPREGGTTFFLDIRHTPFEKTRAVFLFAKSFEFRLGTEDSLGYYYDHESADFQWTKPDSRDEIRTVWSEGFYPAIAEAIGLPIDPVCKDPSRAYFLPACTVEREHLKRSVTNTDRPCLDWRDYKDAAREKLIEYEKRKRRPKRLTRSKASTSNNSSASPRNGNVELAHSRELNVWLAKYGCTYQMATMLAEEYPDLIKGERNQGGYFVDCANEMDHQEAHARTFVTDPDPDSGYSEGFVFHCSGAQCEDVDRAGRLQRWLDDGVILWSDLENEEYGGGTIDRATKSAKKTANAPAPGDTLHLGEHGVTSAEQVVKQLGGHAATLLFHMLEIVQPAALLDGGFICSCGRRTLVENGEIVCPNDACDGNTVADYVKHAFDNGWIAAEHLGVMHRVSKRLQIKADLDVQAEIEKQLKLLDDSKTAADDLNVLMSELLSRSVGLPDEFYRDDEGRWIQTMVKKQPVDVCTAFDVVARTKLHKSGELGVMIAFCNDDGEYCEFAFDQREVKSRASTVIEDLAALGFKSTNDARTKTLLHLLVADKTITTTKQPGWVGDTFALPSGPIGQDEVQVVRDPNGYRFAASGTLEEWQERVACPSEGNSRFMGALCASLAAPLLPLWGCSSFALNLYGKSGEGKTTTCFVGASTFGHGQDYLRSWDATPVGLELLAHRANHTPLVIDEIGQADDSLGANIYMILNETGRTRSNPNIKTQEVMTWKLTMLSSGEFKLGDKMAQDGKQVTAGQQARMLDISASVGLDGVVEDLHESKNFGAFMGDIINATQEAYGTAGPAFIEYVQSNLNTVRSLKSEIQVLANGMCPEGASKQIERAARHFATMALAGEIAVHGGVLPWQPGAASAAMRRLFDDWLAVRGGIDAAEAIDGRNRIYAHMRRYRANFQSDSNDRPTYQDGWIAWNRREKLSNGLEPLSPRTFVWNDEAFTRVCGVSDPSAVVDLIEKDGNLWKDGRNKGRKNPTVTGDAKGRYLHITLPGAAWLKGAAACTMAQELEKAFCSWDFIDEELQDAA